MSKELTNKDKLFILLNVRRQIKKSIRDLQNLRCYQGSGFCTMLSFHTASVIDIPRSFDLLENFPEFEEYAPKYRVTSHGMKSPDAVYWFDLFEPGMQIRLTIINELIAKQIRKL